MTTPAEVGAGKKAFDWIKSGATYVFKLAKRVATLEERVTELENALKKQPADACPFCGERVMRKTEEGRLLGGNPNQWKQDVWTCQACSKTELRIVRF